MEAYLKSAVAIGDLKNAALYFERLVTVFAVIDFVGERDWMPLSSKVAAELLPEDLIRRPGFPEAFGEVNKRGFNWWAKLAIRQHGLEPTIKGLTQEEYDRVEDDAVHAYFSFVEEFGLKDWPLATEDGPATAWMPDDEVQEPLPLLTLSRLQVVDASTLSWELINEIRNDPIALDRLRRLRLFAFENYRGKPRAFVEDDLLSRIADYEACAKQWGLETVQGALSLVLNSKLASGALAGSLVSALFGQPIAALISGTAGAVLEVTGFMLEVQKRRLALDALSRENPVSYISYAKKRIVKAEAGGL